jgi:hypothetical protein
LIHAKGSTGRVFLVTPRNTIYLIVRGCITTYKVKPGNLFVIAEKYGIKPETVLWGNYEVLRDNPQLLKPDQELVILPTNGVYYEWKTGIHWLGWQTLR